MFKEGTLFLIKIYQKTVSPDHGIFSFWLKNASSEHSANNICRFYPTCSEYAYQAIEKKGFAVGAIMALKRISRCHPFNKGGYDPVR